MKSINTQQGSAANAATMFNSISKYVENQMTQQVAMAAYNNPTLAVNTITAGLVAANGVLSNFAANQVNAITSIQNQLSLWI